MEDIYFIDFVGVDSPRSGSSAIFYFENGYSRDITLIDAGYASTSENLINHINTYYGPDTYIDNIIVTHNDNDHAGGVPNILSNYNVGRVWMLRPWIYAEELIDRFARYKNVNNLSRELRKSYSNLADIEDIALKKDIEICEPFQGSRVGQAHILSPSKSFFFDLVVESDKTPTPIMESLQASEGQKTSLLSRAISYIKALWGEENFPIDGTSSENEMSIIQYFDLEKEKYLLTGDAGRRALAEAIDYFGTYYGSVLSPTIFEIPHHGSRHNLSSEILDILFGKKLNFWNRPTQGHELFTSIVQANRKDPNHPRKVVERAIHHRGGKVLMPSTWLMCGENLPSRPNSTIPIGRPYPEEQEE